MNSLKRAFAESRHTPGLRQLKGLLGKSVVDFCVPVNIGFPSPAFTEQLQAQMMERLKYYPSEPHVLRLKFAEFLRLPEKNILAGNGSTELFYNLLAAKSGRQRLLTCVPTFGRWTEAPRAMGHHVIGCPRRPENSFALDPAEIVRIAAAHQVDTVLISNPSNPTGHLTSRKQLMHLIDSLRARVTSLQRILIDESFLDFSTRRQEDSLVSEACAHEDLIVLKSLGKSLGLHGARLGVLVGHPRTLAKLEDFVPYWSVNGIAEAVIELMPLFRRDFEAGLQTTIRATEQMAERLASLSMVEVFPTQTNFVYLRLRAGLQPLLLRDHLLAEHGLLVRSCGNKEGAAADFFRIATRSERDVSQLVEGIKQFAGESKSLFKDQRT